MNNIARDIDGRLPTLASIEELPPYTLFEDHDEHSVVEIPALVPTELLGVVDAGIFIARQLLLPKDSVSFTLEDIASATVTVRKDNADSGSGLLSVNAKLYFMDGSDGAMTADIVNSVSYVDEKTRITLMRIGLAPAHVGRQIRAECEIVVPAAADMDALTLRLPKQSRLEITDIAGSMIKRLDAAVVSGAVQLTQLDVCKLRVAIADGTIDSLDVSVKEIAEFIAIAGQVSASQCSLGNSARFITPGANVAIHSLTADSVSVHSSQSTILVRNVTAKTILVRCRHGSATFEDTSADALSVRTETAPIRGNWTISQSLIILADSAIIRGKLDISGNNIRVSAKTSNWPLQLSISNDYAGSFGIRAVNSVINFGFGNATIYEQTPNWLHGVVGIGPCRLQLENQNAPVVVLPH